MNEEEDKTSALVNSDGEETDDLFEHLKITVEGGVKLIRIDKYLLGRMPQTSRNRIQVAAKAGSILVNQKPVKSNYRVKPFDEVSIVLPYPVRDTETKGENIPLEIVYEDDTLIVLNKVAGMVSHPGHGNYSGTLVNALVYHFDNLPVNKSNEISRPGLVHRLDKFTSGIMVIAKTEHALTHLSKQFFDRTSERTYYALVWGNPKNEKGTITGNIGRSLRDRKVFTVFEDGLNGKHAVTHYEVIKNYAHVSLIKCKLETGRTHQIRVHLKHIGHPLFNDKEYGGDVLLRGNTTASYKAFIENCFTLIPGQALHAKTLGFMHPEKEEFMQFDSELPEGFLKLLDKWEKLNK